MDNEGSLTSAIIEKCAALPVTVARPEGYTFFPAKWDSVTFASAERPGLVATINGDDKVPYIFVGDKNVVSVQRMDSLEVLPIAVAFVCVCASAHCGFPLAPGDCELPILSLPPPCLRDGATYEWPGGERSFIPVDRPFSLPSSFIMGGTIVGIEQQQLIDEGWTGGTEIAHYTPPALWLDKAEKFAYRELEAWREWLCNCCICLNGHLCGLELLLPLQHMPEGISLVDINTPVDLQALSSNLQRTEGITVIANGESSRPVRLQVNGYDQRQVGRKGSVHAPPLPGNALLTAQLVRCIVDAYGGCHYR